MFLRRLRYWLGSAKRAAALRAEMELHLEEKAAELRDAGLSEDDARAEARRRFGNFGAKQDDSREIWIARYWSDFWQDLRYGARSLAAQPGFTFAAVVALVLGIGVNAILFNVYNSLAWEPWAVRDPQQTVQVLIERTGRRAPGFSWPYFRYLQANTKSLAGLAADLGITARVTQGDAAWDLEVGTVSANFFDLLGTGFAAGRGFSAEAANLHDPAPEVVLHYDTWISRFGGDRNIIGTWIELSGHRLQVAGVAAPGFHGATITRTEMWIPAAWQDILNPDMKVIEESGFCCVSVVGRLKPGVSRASAEAELNTLGPQYLATIKNPPARILLTNPSFLGDPTSARAARPIFLAVGAASALILLLACANVANLQLARASARRREIALRISLGASRGRVFRQLMAESLWVSGLAGAASLAVTAWLPAWAFQKIAGPDEHLTFSFSNDVRVLSFTLLATFVAALLFGLTPAFSAIRGATATGLREGSRATSHGRMRSVLLAVQVALCAILLSGTALLVRSLDRLRHLDTGIQYENVLVMNPGLEDTGISDEQARRLLDTLRARITGLAGVESVAITRNVPYGNRSGTTTVDPRTKERVSVAFNNVSADFLETLRIPVLAGRSFTRADEGVRKAIVTEAFVARFWPGENPLGKSVLSPPAEVIGVARNFGARGPGSNAEPLILIAAAGERGARMLLRYSGNAAPFAVELPKMAREIDRRFLASVAPFSETVDTAFRGANVSASVASVLGGLSLLLACVGIYGVAAYNVSQRTREVGIRIALGALPRSILAMVLKQNLWMVAVGAVVGIAGAIAFGRLLTNLLYGLAPSDPLALIAALAVLFATSALAAWGPARRASRVDPAITLRHD